MRDRGTRAPARDWYDLVVQTIALKNTTKAQVAERAGVSRATIDRWGKGASRPAQAASVNAVADVLGIPREQALRLAGIIASTAEAGRVPPFELREGTREAIRRDLGEERAAAVIGFVEGLASGRTEPARDRRRHGAGQEGQRTPGLAPAGRGHSVRRWPSRRLRIGRMSMRLR